MPGSRAGLTALICLCAGLLLVGAWWLPGQAAAPRQTPRVAPSTGPEEDDWKFEEEYAKLNKLSEYSVGGTGLMGRPGAIPPPSATTQAAPPMAAAPRPALKAQAPATLGLSAGGAKDIANFRENIAKGFLPLPTDVTYEGVYYDYRFDIGAQAACSQLFCPSYTAAVSKDPFSGRPERFLSVGLASNISPADFARKKLNLMLVLDISGSMSSPFDAYYYDRFGKKPKVEEPAPDRSTTKLEAAKASLIALLDHLRPDDRFGLVLFDQYAYTALTMRPVAARNMATVKAHIRKLDARGGTHLDAGLAQATTLMGAVKDADPTEFESRIVFLTDAMPNLGNTSDKAFLERIADNARSRIHTTVIGIGVDFNTTLVEKITKAKGANYYSVHSPREFAKRMDEEFDYMVTPLVFDLELAFESQGFKIERVYGSPEADLATGRLMRVNTLFPSPTTEEGARGGLILLKLTQKSAPSDIVLTARYEDRAGQRHTTTQRITLSAREDSYDTPSIRKGILLARYVTLLRNWIVADRQAGKAVTADLPATLRRGGIAEMPDAPAALGEWERQSQRLRVSPEYQATFAAFRRHFAEQADLCQDLELTRELEILDKLGRTEK
jgi:Ca-activated chloride channel family protein